MATAISVLRSELKERMMRRSGTNAFELTDARYDFALRASIRRTASPRVHRHAELESRDTLATVAGTAEYAMNPPLWAIWSIRCTTVGNIRRLTPRGSQEIEEIEQTSGPPLSYARYGRTLILDPIPNAVYSLRISGYHYPTFSATSPMDGNSPLHEIYDEPVLILGQGIIFKRFLNDPEHGDQLVKDWRDELSIIISPDEGDRDDMQDTLMPDYDYMRRG